MSNTNPIGDRLRELRETKGWTREEEWYATRTLPDDPHRHEHGILLVDVVHWAKLYAVQPAWLAFGVGPRDVAEPWTPCPNCGKASPGNGALRCGACREAETTDCGF